MRRSTILVLAISVLAAALASGNASGATRLRAFTITEIGVGARGYVSLTNSSPVSAELGGLYLCQGQRCSALPKWKVAPGRTVRVAQYSGRGLRNVVARYARIGRLRPADGEIELATSSRVTRGSLLAYVQWGTASHTLTSLAVSAGLWIKGSYAPSSPTAVRVYRKKTGLWTYA